jgi:hypothetical protein
MYRTANLPLVGSPILDVALNPLWPLMYGTVRARPYDQAGSFFFVFAFFDS